MRIEHAFADAGGPVPVQAPTNGRRPRRRVRAVFLSDVHLGSRASKSAHLADFLRHHDADAIYLVGDIVDGWRLRSRWHWPQAHSDVLEELLCAARRGCRVVYLPGNHDAFVRDYYGLHFGGIEVKDCAIHIGADGRRYVVTHGDDFDRAIRIGHGFAQIGARANLTLLALSGWFSVLRSHLGLPHWSLSRWAKYRVKKAIKYLEEFEAGVTALAKHHSADGIICGHVHHAAIHDRMGVRYINCGDWLESCTAVAEQTDGSFEIVNWWGEGARRPVEA